MKKIFSKINFPVTPGGNIYHWEEADTIFAVPWDGKYLIAITASAKNSHQNKTKDDDDLRVSIDDYEFGKYEVHDEQISWKGFGTSSSWDGASLKGASKTIYFFLELTTGRHRIKFFADERPALKEIQIFQFENTSPLADKVNPPRTRSPWLLFTRPQYPFFPAPQHTWR